MLRKGLFIFGGLSCANTFSSKDDPQIDCKNASICRQKVLNVPHYCASVDHKHEQRGKWKAALKISPVSR